MTDILQGREKPKQARGRKTVEDILTTASELLAEVGIEKLSTNMICAQAGLAPPSLYRFFPNKYAILKELADRLMEAQNRALANAELELDNLEASIYSVLKEQMDVTLSFASGPILMRSLHAIPVLRDVRLVSHQKATDLILDAYFALVPNVPEGVLRRQVRLIIEVGYAALEYVFDAPDADRGQLLEDASHMLALYHRDLLA